MLGPHDELVGVTRMLIVMHDVGNEDREYIDYLNLLLEVTNCHQVVHSLQRINDMELVVVRVFLEVSSSHLT